MGRRSSHTVPKSSLHFGIPMSNCVKLIREGGCPSWQAPDSSFWTRIPNQQNGSSKKKNELEKLETRNKRRKTKIN